MNAPSMTSEQPERKPVSRRGFLAGLVALCGFLWSLMAAYPIFRYLYPPKSMQAQSNVSSVTVADARDIPVGTGRNFQFGSIPAILLHTQDGEFHAFNAICTHLGCTVQFRPDMQRIWCACHGGQYDPETGKNIAGPPPRPLAPLKAEVVNGKVIVSRIAS
jgi:cytochrome b6-f complex iron-sulfur subunit